MDLRPYQERLVTDTGQALRQGARAVLAVLPTGGGKTVTAATMVQRSVAKKSWQVLWLAARRELVNQAAETLRGFGLHVGVVMAQSDGRDPTAPVQVASLDTLNAWDQCPPADLVIYDEAHGAVATSRQAVLGRNPKARIVGLTATAQRGDGRALGDVFDAMVLGPSIGDLMAENFLVEADVIAASESTKTLSADPVKAWRERAGGRPGFLFAPTIEKSKEYAEELTAANIPAMHVDCNTGMRKRRDAIQGLREGRLDVLSSVGVYKEGTDVPRAAVCMLAKRVNHMGPYLQMVGRVLRTHPGKARALILDLVGAVHLHGLPEEDRQWSLTGKAARRSDTAPAVTQCPCGACWPSGKHSECPVCGKGAPKMQPPRVVERALAKVQRGPKRPNANWREKNSFLAKLRFQANQHNYQFGWVEARFKWMFGQSVADFIGPRGKLPTPGTEQQNA